MNNPAFELEWNSATEATVDLHGPHPDKLDSIEFVIHIVLNIHLSLKNQCMFCITGILMLKLASRCHHRSTLIRWIYYMEEDPFIDIA
jgi:hypothetical protein